MIFICWGVSEDLWKKIFRLNIQAQSPHIHPKTHRISTGTDERRWKNVSVARSAPKTRGERALQVFCVQQPKILALPICIIKGTSLHNASIRRVIKEFHLLRPACFLSLRTTQHDFWSATQRGADYAKALETCRFTFKRGLCHRTGSGTDPDAYSA